jgi:site-specific DNA recombinase
MNTLAHKSPLHSKKKNNWRYKVDKSHKIAIYIRVSTEEQAANPEGSIKSQEQRLRDYVKNQNSERDFGEITRVFVDRAKSGKDTNRVQLQKLLRSVKNQEVSMILVTEISRLSRSLKDFCSMWELMRACNCQFISLRERFNTTTAAGEMVLFSMANFAQFERRQVSERVSANFLARAKRGLFNGGSVPFGYKLNPDKKGYLDIDQESATTVQEVFVTFLKEGSLFSTAKSLNSRGFSIKRLRQGGAPRLGHFTVDNLHGMLTNKSYLGIRVFKENGKPKEVKAVWEAIVDELTFKRAQKKLKSNYRRLKGRGNNRYPYLLSGMTFCGQCGDRLPGKSAHGNGGKIAYYEHGWATKRNACLNKEFFKCEPNRVLAKRLEPAVWEKIVELLQNPQMAQKLLENAKKDHESKGASQQRDKLRVKVRSIEAQIEALVEHLAKVPKDISPAPIYAQMQKLESLKKAGTKGFR